MGHAVESLPWQRLPVVLIGPMAVGKTAIGAQLAHQLGREFIDSDHVIEARHGKISEIFPSRGEAWFRRTEAAVVAEILAGGRPFVLSLGGGAVLDPGTAQLLAGTTVVFLESDAASVADRLHRAGNRPLLQGADPVECWTQLAHERDGVYRRLADLIIDVRLGTPDGLAATIHQALDSLTADTTTAAGGKATE
ncbi:shikimate kinase [Psychromicrobium xiongbiense]|uniref:shikimate kinase n=1 Tax=Psychromicrobium xiongbiense TaxID=3051184 RepID=UPI002555F488|nr:shikimate kinase [Psychromicrobium sp. YIM S02556]